MSRHSRPLDQSLSCRISPVTSGSLWIPQDASRYLRITLDTAGSNLDPFRSPKALFVPVKHARMVISVPVLGSSIFCRRSVLVANQKDTGLTGYSIVWRMKQEEVCCGNDVAIVSTTVTRPCWNN
jgi:hypothetical protein